jgi:hypothetical protein
VCPSLSLQTAPVQQFLAQAQPAVLATLAADSARSLPRIQLMIGPGTLPSVGKGWIGLCAGH